MPPPGGPSGPQRRKPSGVAWWALGVLILAAAAVVAIVFGDDLRGTSAADSQGKTTDKDTTTASADPALPSAGGSTQTPTDTTAPTTDTAAPTTGPTSSAAGGDPLGIGVPMTSPACDGTWVVIVGSATNPDSYAADVPALLGADPQARYVLTEGACASLRQRTTDGNQIYAVYLGPYPDQSSACAVSTEAGGGAYVKRMDDTTPPDQTWEC